MVSSSSSAFSAVVVVAAASLQLHQVNAFTVPSISTPAASTSHASLPKAAPFAVAGISRPNAIASSTSLYMSSISTSTPLALTLEKPLGLILEESEDGIGGVIVTAVNEGGSAYDSPSKDQLINAKVSTVMGTDVTALSFDGVMDVIINAPSPLDVEFAIPGSAAAAEDVVAAEGGEEEEVVPATPTYEVGQTVTITVQQPETNTPDMTIEGKVGDNLRKTLLENKDIELYRGFKKKLGNCGGGGQCGFCALELIDDEGVWGERSDYEAQRIGKNGNDACRLACMNNIVGPATVRTL